jgi:predicted nucleic-acid-binding Zn-ribbon protein
MKNNKKCPKCNSEMEPGWYDGAVWRTWGKGPPKLRKQMSKLALGKSTIAYSCKSCGFVEFYVER